MIYQVVAIANNRVIGKDNKLPWHFSSDLKFFKQLTMGQTIIMGRKTFESISKPLPGRENFILSKSKESSLRGGVADEVRQNSTKSVRTNLAGFWRIISGSPRRPFWTPRDDVKFFDSIEKALKAISTEHGFIIGGASIFQETMPLVDGIYMTKIHADFEGDTFYPKVPGFFKEESKTLLQENPKLEVLFLRNQKKS